MPIEITDDRARVDVAQLHDLYGTTWWAGERTTNEVRRALDHSHPLITAWDGASMIGFTRVISDLTYRATIWDVIVRPQYQGQGVGDRMMQAVLAHPDLATVTMFLLLTKDKHGFYERYGFETTPNFAMILHRGQPRA